MDCKEAAEVFFYLGFQLDCRRNLKEGCLWLVGDGSDIRICTDPWIPSIPGFTPAYPTHLGSLPQLVKDLITTTGNWNEELIYQIFDRFTAEKILKIYINKVTKDKLIWTFTTHGDLLQSHSRPISTLLQENRPASMTILFLGKDFGQSRSFLQKSRTLCGDFYIMALGLCTKWVDL